MKLIKKDWPLSQWSKIRVFQKADSDKVREFISNIIVNEFNFKLEFDTLDSDILAIEEMYNKSSGGGFFVGVLLDILKENYKISICNSWIIYSWISLFTISTDSPHELE